jgi:hypothetical protein
MSCTNVILIHKVARSVSDTVNVAYSTLVIIIAIYRCKSL